MSISPNTTSGGRLLVGVGTTALVAAVGLVASSRPARTAGGHMPVAVTNSPLYAVTQASDDPARQPVSVTQELLGGPVILYVLFTLTGHLVDVP